MLVHHDDEVRALPYFDVLTRLDAAGLLKLVPMGEAPSLCGAMLWRMLPIFSGEYEYVACRDVDAMPMPRDRMCVEEFIASGLAMHAIHDNPAHSGLMGGMIAANCYEFMLRILKDKIVAETFDAMISAGSDANAHGKDQNWLNGTVLPLVAGSLMLHTSKDHDPMSGAMLRPILPRGERPADNVAPGIGVCDWPSKAFALYDEMDTPVIRRIQEIEKCSG